MRLGIDIGSKTIKLALVDCDGALAYSDYRRHHSQIKDALLSSLRTCQWKCGDVEVEASVAGSAGMRIAELFDVPFVQEVVALKRAVEQACPDADSVLEMGGEDTKLLYLSGIPEQRMNTICAGGTGGFIDMMSTLMGVKSDKLGKLAMGYSTIYPIASRCAVFAKADVRPLVNAGARKEDLAASVLVAVCTQAVAGLSAGRPLEGKIVLLGGPFQHISFMKQAFCLATGLDLADVSVPDDAHLFVAKGAAASPFASAPISLAAFIERLEKTDFSSKEGMGRLPPLFSGEDEYQRFKERHDRCKVPRADATGADGDLFLGVDAGSTTMKMALVNTDGQLVAWQYNWNEGDMTRSFPRLLTDLSRSYERSWGDKKTLRRACAIGYGEDFCRAAYGVDTCEVETIAHLRAARELDADVDFVMDIGGQDVKCLYVRDGMVKDVVLNEACSSGCGSLFDAVGRSMHRTKEAFAVEALFAKRPVDLGTRCSTFMDSRVKHAQKEGASSGDIAAGVCWATARNALFKVVRRPDFSQVGSHVVVQGGAFANDALLRAFELETGCGVSRPDLAQVMGAWGAALLARDEWLALRKKDPEAAAHVKSTLLSAKQARDLVIKRRSMRCGLCANACKLAITEFVDGGEGAGAELGAGAGAGVAVGSGAGDDKAASAAAPTQRRRVAVSGNRCERGALAQGAKATKASALPNMLRLKRSLIAALDGGDVGAAGADGAAGDAPSGVRVCVPKVLALYESYPFWHRFFTELDCTVVSAPASDDEIYRLGMGCIPAEGACYPSKLVYGHVVWGVRHGATHIFAPSASQAFCREGLLGLGFDAALRECPLIEEMGRMLQANAVGSDLEKAVFVCPDLLGVRSLDEAVPKLFAAVSEAGIACSLGDIERAARHAQESYRAFFKRLQAASDAALARVDAGEFPGALLIGHPYHADEGIGHEIDGLLESMGYAVFERLAYVDGAGDAAGEGAGASHSGSSPEDASWFADSELFRGIDAAKTHPKLQLVITRSFGCGIDAMTADAAHERIRCGGDGGKSSVATPPRPFAELKIDQIVDLAAVRIRVRSLAWAARQHAGLSVGIDVADGTWAFMEEAEYEATLKAERNRLERKSRAGEQVLCSKKPIVEAFAKGSDRLKQEAADSEANAQSLRDVLVEGMSALGYELAIEQAGTKTAMAQSADLILFKGASGVETFTSWRGVELFIKRSGLAG